MKSLEALHKSSPWKSVSKFLPIALKNGFTESQVREFFKKNIVHDKLNVKSRQYFLPIYGSQSGVYQFDTLIQSKRAQPNSFLIVININSRKGYAYPMTTMNIRKPVRRLRRSSIPLGVPADLRIFITPNGP